MEDGNALAILPDREGYDKLKKPYKNILWSLFI